VPEGWLRGAVEPLLDGFEDDIHDEEKAAVGINSVGTVDGRSGIAKGSFHFGDVGDRAVVEAGEGQGIAVASVQEFEQAFVGSGVEHFAEGKIALGLSLNETVKREGKVGVGAERSFVCFHVVCVVCFVESV